MDGRQKEGQDRYSTISMTAARIGFSLSILAVLLAAGAGLGSRWGWWHFRTGFNLLKWGAYSGIAAAVVSFVGLIGMRRGRHRRSFSLAVLGMLVGLIVVAVPLQWLWRAQRVPPIHDITTDTEDPPRFVAMLKLREGAPNPADYGGPEIAALQKAGYPNLHPLILHIPPEVAFDRAVATAEVMRWEIVDANPAEGRIEATDTTFWFGFKDDFVVRVTPTDSGARIDVRSVSRVGRSDVGTNARRIKKYLKRLAEKG